MRAKPSCGLAMAVAVVQGAAMRGCGGAALMAREALVDQLAGGVRAVAPSESSLLLWPEPATTALAGVAPFLKALSWYSAHLHQSTLRGKPSIWVFPIGRCWRSAVMSLMEASFMELD